MMFFHHFLLILLRTSHPFVDCFEDRHTEEDPKNVVMLLPDLDTQENFRMKLSAFLYI